MMRRFLGNKFAFAAIVFAFALAQSWNAQHSTGLPFPVHSSSVLQEFMLAQGPSIPPVPWAGGNPATLIAHGPSIPPDPWAGGGGGFRTV